MKVNFFFGYQKNTLFVRDNPNLFCQTQYIEIYWFLWFWWEIDDFDEFSDFGGNGRHPANWVLPSYSTPNIL